MGSQGWILSSSHPGPWAWLEERILCSGATLPPSLLSGKGVGHLGRLVSSCPMKTSCFDSA